jgi:hypothetical protein
VAFREVLLYLSLEPFRRCWYTQFLVALKESALPAPASPTDVVYRFLYLPTSILEGVRTDRRVLVDHWSPQEVGPDAAFRRAATISWISRTSRQTRATEGAI